jgi:hypothetical protein
MGALALPFALTSEPSNILPTAGWTNSAVLPAMGDHVGNAVIGIGEVNDGVLKGLWGFHTSNLKANDLICQVYICPYKMHLVEPC